MTRLFTEGGESGDMLRWTSWDGVTSVTSNQHRTGNYCIQTASWNSSSPPVKIVGSLTEFFLRIAIRDNTSLNTTNFLEWYNGGTLSGKLCITGLSTATSLTIYDGGNLRATSSTISWLGSEWHVIEVHVKLVASPNGIFQVKFDGTLVIDWAGTTNGAAAAMDRFMLRPINTGFGADTYFDDIAFNDTAGSVDNSWPGDGGVLAALVPNGPGTYSDLIASAGSAYACIDEIPLSTTSVWGDYVSESTVDKKSTYALSDLAGLPAGASVARVWIEMSSGKTAADGSKVATLLRSGSHDEQGADQNLPIALARIISPEYLTDPQDTAAWTTAKVNALEAGAVVR